ncbi:MAG: hypothetical protein QOE71_3029 [Pseudonocardiales bacterium]|nr:hypothetical protein [Pseudonocardiales bacterium]MDQ1751973.1 hypothetical protein [Pseudonocardiales bacterium]
MTVFIGYALIALIVAAILFYAVVALLPEGVSFKPQADRRPFELPTDRRMVREDLDVVRIPVSLRGYRFAETDDLIDRLAAEIVVRDEEIARLRQADAELPPHPPVKPGYPDAGESDDADSAQLGLDS